MFVLVDALIFEAGVFPGFVLTFCIRKSAGSWVDTKINALIIKQKDSWIGAYRSLERIGVCKRRLSKT